MIVLLMMTYSCAVELNFGVMINKVLFEGFFSADVLLQDINKDKIKPGHMQEILLPL